MTFLFYNVGCDFESIAMRVKYEGYPIYYYKRKEAKKDETGVGIFKDEEMVDDLYECLNKFKNKKKELIILMDDNGQGDEADYLKSEGWYVIGGSAWGDEIEYKRDLGLDIMNDIGLDTPFEKNFNNLDDAIEFLQSEEEDAEFVFKPNGEDFTGSSRTYMGKNRQDLIDYIKWTKQDNLEKHTGIGKFVLQEKVEGIEVDISSYASHGKFLPDLVLLDIEEKKSGDGNKGEATGCMGNIVVNVGKSKFFDMYLKPLEPHLKKIDYTGPISLNNIFSSKEQGNHKTYGEGEPFGLEFTPRFGWDAHLTELAMLKNAKLNICDFYIALVKGKSFKFPVNKIGCGIRIYSGSVNLKKEDVAGRFFSFPKNIMKYLWFYNVSYKKKSFIIEDNPVLVVNTIGTNVRNVTLECYDIVKQLNIPDIYYRMEIGKRGEEVLTFLKEHQWI